MCAETINETINVCKYVGHERKNSFIEGEVILQDIKPDILSIVRVTRETCINRKKVEDGKIRIDGTLDVCIVYVADDDTNSLRGMSSKIDFSDVIDLGGINENSIIRLKYQVGSAEYKVINGRKVAIKVPITFDIKAFNNCDINIVKGIMNDEEMQTQKVTQNICSPILQNSSNVELKENIKLDECNSPIGEILNCSFCITNKEYKLSYNKVLAKAEAKVKIVYVADNERQNVETFETLIPVMGFVDVDGVNENSVVSIDYDVNNYCIRPTYQDMQSNAISVEADIEITVFSFDKEEIELITDFYMPSSIINIESQKNSVVKDFIDIDENIEISQTLVVPELDNTTILGIDGICNINERNVLNGKLAITGNIDINVLYAKNDSRMIENKKLELPIQQVIKIENLTNDMEPLINVNIENVEYMQNGENQIQVKFKLTVTVVGDREDDINSVTNLEISNEDVPQMPSMVVYFVKTGDTLWNIAKSFRSTVDYIKEINELKDDNIYPGQRLIIPRLQMNVPSNPLM